MIRSFCTVWAIGAIVLLLLFSVLPPRISEAEALRLIIGDAGIGIIAALLIIAYREPK
jgi:hypothetical protein